MRRFTAKFAGLVLALVIVFSLNAHGQGVTALWPPLLGPSGTNIPFAKLTFCTLPTGFDSLGNCLATVTVYKDQALTTPYPSAITTDGLGNFPPNQQTTTALYFPPSANLCFSATSPLINQPVPVCTPFSLSLSGAVFGPTLNGIAYPTIGACLAAIPANGGTCFVGPNNSSGSYTETFASAVTWPNIKSVRLAFTVPFQVTCATASPGCISFADSTHGATIEGPWVWGSHNAGTNSGVFLYNGTGTAIQIGTSTGSDGANKILFRNFAVDVSGGGNSAIGIDSYGVGFGRFYDLLITGANTQTASIGWRINGNSHTDGEGNEWHGVEVTGFNTGMQWNQGNAPVCIGQHALYTTRVIGPGTAGSVGYDFENGCIIGFYGYSGVSSAGLGVKVALGSTGIHAEDFTDEGGSGSPSAFSFGASTTNNDFEGSDITGSITDSGTNNIVRSPGAAGLASSLTDATGNTTANSATAGFIRMTSGDFLCWLNNAASGNVGITKDTSDVFHIGNCTANDNSGSLALTLLQTVDFRPFNGTSSAVSSTSPDIYGSGGSASYPFNAAGHLIIQPRSSGAVRDTVFFAGNPATQQWAIKGAGSLAGISGNALNWVSASDLSASPDTGLSRGPAGVVDVGNGTAGDSSGTIKPRFLLAGGSAAGLTGTGACASFSNQAGGALAGTAKCTGTTGASTLTITPGATAPNGWTCYVQDETTRANLFQQTSHSQTTCVLTVTSVTQNDVFVFQAIAF